MVGFAQFDEDLQAPGLEQVQRFGPGFVSTVEQLRYAVQFGQHAAGADKGAHVHQAGQLTRLHGGRLFDWAIRWDYACLTDELAINKTHTCNKLMHYSGAAAGCDPLANC